MLHYPRLVVLADLPLHSQEIVPHYVRIQISDVAVWAAGGRTYFHVGANRPDSMSQSDTDEHLRALETSYEPLATALDEHGCEAFVHIGDRFDDTMRYLTRFGGPDRAYTFVYTPDQSVLCSPSLFAEQARREFVGDTVRTVDEQDATNAGGRAVETLQSLGSVDRVLVDESIREAEYRRVANAYEVVVADVDVRRRTKTEAERRRHERTQAAAQHGMARAEEIFAEATPDGDDLRWEGDTLTTERVRREVNAVMASHGITDAGNTVIGAGESCADLHFKGEDHIHPDQTVLLDISPRGTDGYYGDFTRTFVAGEVGDWEQDAYEAVRAAHDAALATLEEGAGLRAGAPHEAACEVLESRGYQTGDVGVGLYHGVGHGIGVSLHEDPGLSGDEPLEAGTVVTVEPGLYDPDRGGVRIEDIGVVTEDSFNNLTDYPRSIRPNPDAHEW